MILIWANPLLRPLEGVGPEISTFLGPNCTRFACCHFRAQESLDFMASQVLKSVRPTPYKQQEHEQLQM
jgi:hypothetical protein